MWNKCGMARTEQGLKEAVNEIKTLREDFLANVNVPGEANQMNKELEKAGRVADFLELGELFAKDALHRNESCGGHFREEYATVEGKLREMIKISTMLQHGNIKETHLWQSYTRKN